MSKILFLFAFMVVAAILLFNEARKVDIADLAVRTRIVNCDDLPLEGRVAPGGEEEFCRTFFDRP